MKNTHLQHPEDAILTGDLTVLDWFTDSSSLSVKIDGCPAIVWGTNPANGKFFVGTKSVFNKVKIKINHSHEEIDANHEGEVALILHACLANLPRTDSIVQGDFIGFGGDDTYTPNTITYVFDEIIEQTIIVAPHTLYTAENDLRDAIASPLIECPDDTDTCKFVMPRCWQIDEDFDEIVAFARQMSTTCEFLTDKQSRQVQQQLNSIIRAGLDIDDITLDALAFANQIDVNVLRLWKLVASIKMDMLYLCRNNGPKAYIGNRQCGGEGYVRTNNYGMFKLVDRMQFSHANFNNGKFACAS
tara:strand:- start:335 stop:1237 length:903 start_codon:yes stop_codon:yes gene_type:complete